MRKFVIALVTVVTAALVTAVGATPAQAAGGVIIYRAYYNSPGADNWSNASLNAEYIQLKNTTRTAKFVTGWTLRDRQNQIYKFPATRIDPGKYLTVHTGRGTNNAAHRYWNRNQYVWNNTGDAAFLRTPRGIQVDTCSWGSTGNWKYC